MREKERVSSEEGYEIKEEFVEKQQATLMLNHNLSFRYGLYVKAKKILKWKAQNCRGNVLEFVLRIQVIHGGS